MTGEAEYWNRVYQERGEAGGSWFEEVPELSVQLIIAATAERRAAIDIGGGASRLPQALLDAGFADVAALDISAQAQQLARERMGLREPGVRWITADLLAWQPDRAYDVWHDRAVLHFFTEEADRRRYAALLKATLAPGGVAVIGTFAPDGPERCSGLPVMRHDARSLAAMLGPAFELVAEHPHDHVTPSGAVQKFQFSTFRSIAPT